MLALPAEPCRFGEGFFHDWSGIDEHFQVLAGGPGSEAAGDALELALDDVVVIAVLRIDRNRRLVFLRQNIQRVAIRPVIHGEHDDRAHLRPQCLRVGPALFRLLHPFHTGVPPERQILAQPLFGKWNGIGAGDGNEIESSRAGFLEDELLQPLCV